tara:strand:+ start:216 stop:458 length:243 start_codon:yes stop_codon:yes gene_type:complete
MANNFPPVSKIFDDLDKFRDYCRFEGKVFNEADLYKADSYVWGAYQKHQGWMRAKARNGGKDFVPRDRRPNPRFNHVPRG